jgi:hypothetical protein
VAFNEVLVWLKQHRIKKWFKKDMDLQLENNNKLTSFFIQIKSV